MARSTSSIGVAVIGAGMAGKAHAAAYRAAGSITGPELPAIDLVSIADLNQPLAQDAAQRFGYRRSDGDWRALVEADDVHVVSIVVANHLHREIAEALLAAGKHVLCEKPMAPTIPDAEAMVAAARAAREQGVQSAVGFTFRRSPAIAAVREQVDSGAIGRPVHFNGHYWCDYSCDPKAPMSWRYKGAAGSGALADIGSHLSDLAEFVCGPIVAVTGATLSTQVTERALPLGTVVGHGAAELSDVREPVENDDLAAFTATFASGAVGTLSASRIAYGHPNALGFELFAERGAAIFDLERAGEFGFIDGAPVAGHRPQGYRQVLVGPEHPYLTGGLAMDFPGVGYGQNDLFVWQARAFLDQVCGLDGLPAPATFEAGLHNLKLLAAVVESAQNGGVEVKVEERTREADRDGDVVTATGGGPGSIADIGIGVIGFGWMGQAHARSARRIPTHFPQRGYRPRLVAVADVDPARREQAVQDWGFASASADWAAVVESPEVDAVWVTTPNMMHVELVAAAASAGKAVFCEKPVGGRPEDIGRARQATERAGVLTGVGYCYRWAPLVQHARRMIADGALGRITHYRGRFFSMYGSDPLGLLSWRFRLEEGGYGTSSDLLSHSVDLAHFLLGGPIRRLVGTRATTITHRPLATGASSHYGRGRPGDPTGEVTNEDFTSLLAEFDAGVTATFESSRSMVGPESQNAFEVYGTEGALAWNLERLNELQVYRRADADPTDPHTLNTGWTTVYGGDRFPYHGSFVPGAANPIGFEDLVAIEDHEFLQALAAGTAFEPGLREAAEFAAVQAALIRSWESRAWEGVVALPVPAEVPR